MMKEIMKSHYIVKWPTIVMEVNKEEKKVIIYGSVGHTVLRGIHTVH